MRVNVNFNLEKDKSSHDLLKIKTKVLELKVVEDSDEKKKKDETLFLTNVKKLDVKTHNINNNDVKISEFGTTRGKESKIFS